MNNEDLFKGLPEVGLRPGCYKMPVEMWRTVSGMKDNELMTNEELRFYCILFYKARHDRQVYTRELYGSGIPAEIYKIKVKALLGLYANQEVISRNVGLSLEYIPRENENGRDFNPSTKVSAGALNENGDMYLPGFGGGKGKFVPPFQYFRDRPIQYLIGYWNAQTSKLDIPRADLIHTEVCDNILRDVEVKFNITFPYEIRSRLSVNSFVKRNR